MYKTEHYLPQFTSSSSTRSYSMSSFKDSSSTKNSMQSQENDKRYQPEAHPSGNGVNPHEIPRGVHDAVHDSDMPRLWQEGDPYRFAPRRRGDPWEECMKRVDQYDDEMCRAWKEDIDTLLTFAGLFSAAVTAFIIESYHWLQTDPNDVTVTLLQQIARELNTAVAVSSPPSVSTPGYGQAVRINTVWFLSLILSLSAVLLGILSKQWLREYRRDTPSSSQKEAMEIRQIRFESLEKWGVPTLLASLPLLLQIALVLFFMGILDLLWSLNFIAAAFSTAVAGVSIFILCFTTILPAYYLCSSAGTIFTDEVLLCPFKSPQAWLFYKLALLFPLIDDIKKARYQNWAFSDLHFIRDHFPSSRLNARTHLVKGLRWLVTTFSDSTVMANHIFHCLQGFSVEVAAIATGKGEEASRDVIYYNFFKNSSWDPEIGKFLAEIFLRQINSGLSLQPPRGVGDSLGSFWNLAVIDLVGDGSEQQTELLFQIIASMKSYCAANRITLLDMTPMMLVCKELWKHPEQSVRERSITLLDDFEQWLARTGEELQMDFIPSLASSLAEIIESENERGQGPTSAFITSEKGPKFIKLLDRHILSRNIDIDRYSLQDMPMSWDDAKLKMMRLSGLPSEYFDDTSPETTSTPDSFEDVPLEVSFNYHGAKAY